MRLEFLAKANRNKLILIFAGWSSDAALYSEVASPGWDVALVSGTDVSAPDWKPLHSYETIYLYAWSMGVYFAEKLLPRHLNITRAYALNGTPYPCSDKLGIPEAIFIGTAQNLNERNLLKFRIRMCGSRAEYEHIAEKFTCNDIEALRSQLLAVSADREERRPLPWTAAYISADDKIFPPSNQENAWQSIVEIRHLPGEHYVSLQGIIAHTAINVEKVGRRFNKALSTYTEHAHAQRVIAGRLAGLFRDMAGARAGSVIEIGSGTGLFTFAWSRLLAAERVLFMDLCDMPKYGVAANEDYMQGDAEEAIARMAAECPGTVDAIISASAIQWFSNPEAFINNCYKLLRRRGVIAFSTFSAGNLPELTALRTDPMHYPGADVWQEYFEPFSKFRLIEEDVEIDFTTPVEALKHLRLTGVTGSGAKASIGEIRRFSELYPQNNRGRYSLTFKPLYLIARK